MHRTLAIALFVALALPMSASAVTIQEVQAQIQALLAQINAMQQQVAPTSISQPLQSQAQGVTCPILQNSFGLGSSGSAVSVLQSFLANRHFLSATAIDGHFGAGTEAALKLFQAQQGIVSSGDPATTGYGYAGPKTRATVTAMCVKDAEAGGAISSSGGHCTSAPPPSALCTSGWQPLSRIDGCVVQYYCAALQPTASSTNYSSSAPPSFFTCPNYPAPHCGPGEYISLSSIGANGCPGPLICKQ